MKFILWHRSPGSTNPFSAGVRSPCCRGGETTTSPNNEPQNESIGHRALRSAPVPRGKQTERRIRHQQFLPLPKTIASDYSRGRRRRGKTDEFEFGNFRIASVVRLSTCRCLPQFFLFHFYLDHISIPVYDSCVQFCCNVFAYSP